MRWQAVRRGVQQSVDFEFDGSGCVACDKKAISVVQGFRGQVHLCRLCFRIIVHNGSEKDFFQGSPVVSGSGPFSELSAEIITAFPESAVESFRKNSFPFRALIRRWALSGKPEIKGIPVHGNGSGDIIGGAAPAFDFQDGNAAVKNFPQTGDGAEIFWRHDIVIVNQKFRSGLRIPHGVFPAAALKTGSAICGTVEFGKTHVTFP